ncbi:MAG: hypothetical protein SFV32_06725, partial [Opitutaceae bacterium]|nr:hypothetical protein [Opitutaceae bacterium]
MRHISFPLQDAHLTPLPQHLESVNRTPVSGYNDSIHDGLLVSSLASLGADDSFGEVFYYNARGIESEGVLAEAARLLGERLRIFTDIDALPLEAIAERIGRCRTALIVD